jgi:heptosyltransferase II
MKLLVMQQKMVGDVLTSSLLCENLVRLRPGTEVHFLAHRTAAAVLEGNPNIHRVHAYSPRAPLAARIAMARRLRDEGYDLVIDAYGKLESLLLLAAIRPPRSIGYRKPYTQPLYTDQVRRNTRTAFGLPLAIEHRLQLLEPLLGPLAPERAVTRPRLYIDSAERAVARDFLATHGIGREQPLLMIGALGSGPRKTYPLPAMARLLDRIVERSGARLLFNCLPSQRAEAGALYRLCAAHTRGHIAFDATPASLREFIAVLAECDGLFGNEGGAVNMARALDVPSFSIFSPFVPRAVWDIDADGLHPAVHLADFLPDRVDGRSTSALRRAAPRLYACFDPAWIEPALDRFIDALPGRARC